MLYQLRHIVIRNVVNVYAVRSMPFKPAAAPDWTAPTMILFWDVMSRKFLWDDLMNYEPANTATIIQTPTVGL